MHGEAFDRQATLDRLDDDMELLSELATMFREDGPVLLDEIRTAIAQQEPGRLAVSAHTLKGAASNFFAEPTVEAAGFLERMGRASSLDDAEYALQELDQRMSELLVALEDLPVFADD